MSGRFVVHLAPPEAERRRLAAAAEIEEALWEAGGGRLWWGFQSALADRYHVNSGTACRWVAAVRAGGAGALRAKPQGGSDMWLDEGQREELRDMLVAGAVAHGYATDVWTGRRVADIIERTFGVRYDPKYVPEMLRRRLGFTRQKPQRVSREVDPERVRAWKRDAWAPAKRGRSKAA